ncbi:MAG: hypothetical protein ACO1TE_21195 [Prosthecobacter sp.]
MKTPALVVATMSMVLAMASALAYEPQHFSQEVPWTGTPAASDHRTRLRAVVFPEFVFVGDFEGVIDHLRNEFRKYSPNGGPLGKFVIRSVENEPKRLNIRLRGRNTLEILDNLCALTRSNWTLAPHAIVIDRPVTDPLPPQRLSHELPSPDDPKRFRKPVIGGMTLREWTAETVFPEFKFSGTLGEAIEYLMVKSREFSPTGAAVGGFTIRSGDIAPGIHAKTVALNMKGKNALEIIDAICGVTNAAWRFDSSRILILDPAEDHAK